MSLDIKLVYHQLIKQVHVHNIHEFKLNQLIKLSKKFPSLDHGNFTFFYLNHFESSPNNKVYIQSNKDLERALVIAYKAQVKCFKIGIALLSHDGVEDIDEEEMVDPFHQINQQQPDHVIVEEDDSDFELIDASDNDDILDNKSDSSCGESHFLHYDVQSPTFDTLGACASNSQKYKNQQQYEDQEELDELEVEKRELEEMKARHKLINFTGVVEGGAHDLPQIIDANLTCDSNAEQQQPFFALELLATDFNGANPTIQSVSNDMKLQSTEEIEVKEKLEEKADPDVLNRLRIALSNVLSDAAIVEQLQIYLGTKEINKFIVTFFTAEKNGADPLAAVSLQIFSVLAGFCQIMGNHPQICSIVPVLTEYIMSMHALSKMASNMSSSSCSIKQEDKTTTAVTTPSVIAEEKTTPRIPENQVALCHEFICCNGCLDKNADTITTSYIRGIRYKSFIVENFNLCEECEKEGLYEESHGPFVKISTQSHIDRLLNYHVCKIEEEKKTISTPAKEEPVIALTEPVKVEVTSSPFSTAISRSQPTKKEKVCPLDHKLRKRMALYHNMTCDRCNALLIIDNPYYTCRVCNFDVCMDCFKQQPEKEITLQKVEVVKQATEFALSSSLSEVMVQEKPATFLDKVIEIEDVDISADTDSGYLNRRPFEQSLFGKFTYEMESLAEMGFVDIVWNMDLLNKHNGDIQQVLNILVHGKSNGQSNNNNNDNQKKSKNRASKASAST